MKHEYSIVYGKFGKYFHVYRTMSTEDLNVYIANMLSAEYMLDIQVMS
jgi:hypothetical protein